jgi:hypothetical protein
MDIFSIVFAHQDPAKLLHKYPGRFPLMHLRDIRKDTALGNTRNPGEAEGIISVPEWATETPFNQSGCEVLVLNELQILGVVAWIGTPLAVVGPSGAEEGRGLIEDCSS